MCEESHCHICGEITEFICEDCEEPVCEKCAIAYTPQNNCEGTHCSECYGTSQMQWTEEIQREEEIQRQKDKKRKEKNAKRRAWYNSPKQIEKRRLAKIELIKQRREYDFKCMKEIGNILKGFRF